MNITVSARELEKILDATPPEQNVMLVGRHGTGKSEILLKYYSSRGQKVVSFFLGRLLTIILQTSYKRNFCILIRPIPGKMFQFI